MNAFEKSAKTINFLSTMKKEQKTEQMFQQSKTCKMFTFAKDKEGKIVILTGNYVISQKKFDNFKQAEEYVATKPYELIFNTFFAIIENEKNKTNAQENKPSSENN